MSVSLPTTEWHRHRQRHRYRYISHVMYPSHCSFYALNLVLPAYKLNFAQVARSAQNAEGPGCNWSVDTSRTQSAFMNPLKTVETVASYGIIFQEVQYLKLYAISVRKTLLQLDLVTSIERVVQCCHLASPNLKNSHVSSNNFHMSICFHSREKN